MNQQVLNKFDEVLEQLGDNSAEFFLAASLYHAQKISFSRASELSGLSFDEFKYRLKEHFGTGFIISPEVISGDMDSADTFLNRT